MTERLPDPLSPPDGELEIDVDPAFDFVGSLRLQRMGHHDPTAQLTPDSSGSVFEKAARTPEGVAAVRLVHEPEHSRVWAGIWGPA